MILVSVIIPTYRATEHLLLCVKSLARAASPFTFEVCIYGDGGGETAREAIAESERILNNAGVKCITFYNPENLGNTPAVNRAAALANGQWLFFCNDDMVFPNNWLSKCEPLLKPGRVLSVSCIEPPVQGHKPSRYFYASDLGLDPAQFEFNRLDNFVATHTATHSILEAGVHYPFFVERHVFERIGGADERFRGPYHDPDLFLRFRNSGLEMVRTQQTALYHFSGVSLRFSENNKKIKKRKKSRRWVDEENRARLNFIEKWGAKPKSKFGEIPKTDATAEFDWDSQSRANKVRVQILLAWERLRAKIRISRY